MTAVPKFIKKQVEDQNSEAAQAQEPVDEGAPETARKRDYEIVDEQALYNANPNLFKLVPNYRKITQALKLGFALPGIRFFEEQSNQTDEGGQ